MKSLSGGVASADLVASTLASCSKRRAVGLEIAVERQRNGAMCCKTCYTHAWNILHKSYYPIRNAYAFEGNLHVNDPSDVSWPFMNESKQVGAIMRHAIRRLLKSKAFHVCLRCGREITENGLARR